MADLARIYAAQRDNAQAKALITEALTLGGRNVALAAVEVLTALEEPEAAKAHVEDAYREAWADGPPYAFYHELKRIRAAIQALGIPEPQLPPFDPAKVPPVPYEAEIRAFIDELRQEQGGDSSATLVDADSSASQALDSKPKAHRPWWRIWARS
jgi:hypothetical protein